MYKQVLIYRRDLKMRKGKIAAQCAHAAVRLCVQCFTSSFTGIDRLREWYHSGQKKIVLSVDTLEELYELQAQAAVAGLRNAIVTDTGATEFHGVATVTVLGIGPCTDEEVDPITRNGDVATKLA
jgi:peptidyl-tRNA hydrolase, PTH2 family